MRRWCAVAPPGLEAVVVRELQGHGLVGEVEPGVVSFSATLEEGARLAWLLRSPTRVLLELAQGPARTSPQLTALIEGIDWAPLLPPDAPVVVEASARGSHLCRTDGLERTGAAALAAVQRRLPPAQRRSPDPQRVALRLVDNVATVSLDAGGPELLHLRGWRTEQGRAPLRENLAAALLIAGGYTGYEPLVDPFCGAGTLAIEGALMAAGRSPYVGRRLACAAWPALRAARSAMGAAQPRRGTTSRAVIVLPAIRAADRDPAAVAMTLANAERAGVDIEVLHCDVGAIEAPAPLGLVVANPPYGQRIGDPGGHTYATFGRTLRERFGGWRAVFLAPGEALAQKVDPRVTLITTFSNGGSKVGIFGLTV